jgi:hypothetical protein
MPPDIRRTLLWAYLPFRTKLTFHFSAAFVIGVTTQAFQSFYQTIPSVCGMFQEEINHKCQGKTTEKQEAPRYSKQLCDDSTP